MVWLVKHPKLKLLSWLFILGAVHIANIFKLLVLFCLVLTMGSSVSAIESSNITGGGTSTDYQPTTQNPQNDVRTGLQQNAGGLQPTPGNNAASQERLPKVSDLQVLGAQGKPNPNVTKTETAPVANRSSALLFPILLIGAVATIAIVYFVCRQYIIDSKQAPSPSEISKDLVGSKTVSTTAPSPTVGPKTHQSKRRKKSSKKKKK